MNYKEHRYKVSTYLVRHFKPVKKIHHFLRINKTYLCEQDFRRYEELLNIANDKMKIIMLERFSEPIDKGDKNILNKSQWENIENPMTTREVLTSLLELNEKILESRYPYLEEFQISTKGINNGCQRIKDYRTEFQNSRRTLRELLRSIEKVPLPDEIDFPKLKM